MKSKIAVLISLLACACLAVILVTAQRTQARERQSSIKTHSNDRSHELAGPEESETLGDASAKQLPLKQTDLAINELGSDSVSLRKQRDEFTSSIGNLEIEIAEKARKRPATQDEHNLIARELAISQRREFRRFNLSGVTTKGGAQALMPEPAKPLADAINYDRMVKLNHNATTPTAPSSELRR